MVIQLIIEEDYNQGMFDFVQNLGIIQQACEQFLKSHQAFYNISNELIPDIAKYPNLRLDTQQVNTTLTINNNNLNNKISLQLINNIQNSENCIVYLHGLSSYCIEGKFLIPFLGDSLSLCLYDSRGHGKNKAEYVTYGLLESIELFQILKVLCSRGFKNIILWGRSMGAVTCLRTIQQYGQHSAVRSVKYVVADSPFSSFKMIATELVCKMVMLPEFIAGIVADAFANKINERYGINLKEISFQSLTSNAPVAFLFSSRDQMMGKQHIQEITKNLIGERQTIDIDVTHNQQRPKRVIIKLISTIKQLVKEKPLQRKNSENKKRGLSITRIGSNKYLNMITPTCIPRCAPRPSNLPPQVSFERRGTISKNRSKENLDYYRKSTVQEISKFSSVELNKLSKSTTNRQNVLKNKMRKVAFDNFV